MKTFREYLVEKYGIDEAKGFYASFRDDDGNVTIRRPQSPEERAVWYKIQHLDKKRTGTSGYDYSNFTARKKPSGGIVRSTMSTKDPLIKPDKNPEDFIGPNGEFDTQAFNVYMSNPENSARSTLTHFDRIHYGNLPEPISVDDIRRRMRKRSAIETTKSLLGNIQNNTRGSNT